MKARYLNRQNNFVRWCIFIGINVLVVISILILFIDFDFLRNPHLLTDRHLRIILFVIAGLVVIFLIRGLINYLAYRLNRRYLKQFHHIKWLGAYQESRQRMYLSDQPLEHVVLCLHGFAGSPQEFDHLYPLLEAQGLPFYAPNIVGFGIDSTNILRSVRVQDWERSAFQAYDILAGIAQKVSIIGVSMGANLAIAIAERRQPHKLLLVSPAAYLNTASTRYKTILSQPIISSIFAWFVPYIPKLVTKERGYNLDMMDVRRGDKLFHYLAVPTRSVKQLLLLQYRIRKRIQQLRCQALHVFYGEHDITVNVPACLKLFDDHHIPYTTECFEQTGHSPFEDYDREKASEAAIQFLSDQ